MTIINFIYERTVIKKSLIYLHLYSERKVPAKEILLLLQLGNIWLVAFTVSRAMYK